MQLYKNIPVTLHVQSYGTVFLMVLKGNEKDIETVFTALYNHGATNEGSEAHPIKPEFTDEYNTVAYFWSSPEKMLTFFKSIYHLRNDKIDETLHRRNNGWKRYKGGENSPLGKELIATLEKACEDYAKEQLALLKKESSISFNPHGKTSYPEFFGQGSMGAEKPDDDFKDSVLKHAFKESGKPDIENLVED